MKKNSSLWLWTMMKRFLALFANAFITWGLTYRVMYGETSLETIQFSAAGGVLIATLFLPISSIGGFWNGWRFFEWRNHYEG